MSDSPYRLHSSADGPALIILALITSNIRNCILPSSKIKALDVFLALSPHLTDEAKLDRMIPYIVDLFHDEAAIVRMAALRTAIQVVSLILVSNKNTVKPLSADGRYYHHSVQRCHLPGIYHS